MKNAILLVIALVTISDLQSQVLTGTITDEVGFPISNARVTLFNNDTTLFWETRTDINGRYFIDNLPDGGPYLYFGVSALGKEYFQNATTGIIDTLSWHAVLIPETNKGNWEVIVESPEPLGGTDLGVLMPDGRIYYCHNTKDPFYFNPVTNDTSFTVGDANVQGCVGPLQTDDGKVWFMGGTLQEVYGPGTRKVKYFDPENNQWTVKPNMLDYRWYPTVAMLPSGKFLVAGGGNLDNPVRTNSSEIYDPSTGQTAFTDDLAIGNEVSPIVVLYNGKVLMTHRPPQLFDPETNQWDSAGSFIQTPRLPNGDHSDCELVLMPDGEAIAVGYKSFTPGVFGTFIERYDPEFNRWSLGSSTLPIRSRAKTCLLPDKKILVMGGYKEDNSSATVNQWGYMKITDLYDPASDSWRRLDNLNYFREYHALTILVPDGRVIAVGGEGSPGNEPPFSVIEAFNPPYLFRGVRPEIDSLHHSSFARGAKIELDFSKTDSLTEVILMSNAVVTHFMNSGNNRYISLDYTQNGNHITANLPRDSVKLIPGFYMLFIMVDDIPSVGRIIHVQNELESLANDIGFLDSTYVWIEVYTDVFFPNMVSVKYTIAQDSTWIGGKSYFEVIKANSEFSEEWLGTGRLIRYENGIVYEPWGLDERELYNFNLGLGDTFNLTSGFDQQLVVFIIDSISLSNGEKRKRWQLHCAGDEKPFQFGVIEWIDGIGNINGLFLNDEMCLFDVGGSEISCMYRNDTLIYDDPELNGCWFMTTSLNSAKPDDIIFVPNPATDFINLVGLEQEINYFRIFNIVGSLVYQGNEDIIDLRKFSSGYYHAVIVLKDNRTFTKGFVKL